MERQLTELLRQTVMLMYRAAAAANSAYSDRRQRARFIRRGT